MSNSRTILGVNQMILIEDLNKLRLVKTSEIHFLEADDNYCKIYLSGKEKITSSRSLKSIEQELNSNSFFRCHKSFLVNVIYIKEFIVGKNENIIVLVDNTKLPVARRRIFDLKQFLYNQVYRSPVS